MADRAAKGLHRMRTGRADKEIEPGVRGIGLRHAALHGDFERLAPLGSLQEAGRGNLSRERLAAVDVHDHVTSDEPSRGGGCLGQHHAHGGVLGLEEALRGQMKAVGILELLIAVAFDGETFGGLGRRLERERDGFCLSVGGISRRTGS